MILYDPHKVTNFIRLRGSVFPRAIRYSIIPALLALVLKILDMEGIVDLNKVNLSKEKSIYQGFTFVLGFILVFRASQSYQRYWSSARAVHQMGAEWYDAAASLIAFAHSSDSSQKDINSFAHLTVRLFSILHAMALEEIAGIIDEGFPFLDIEGMEADDLRILTSPSSQGRKVEIVNQWIKSLILGNMKSKMLVVPPPIITRVFQQLGSGLVHYHEVLQAVIWPFPFPYAQMSFSLLLGHSILTPLILSQNAEHAASASLLTFVSVACMKGIELIAAELENPFGQDANDLPTFEMHHEMVEDLIVLTLPRTFKVPRLSPQAILDHERLNAQSAQRHKQLMKRQKDRPGGTAATTLTWSSSNLEKAASQSKMDRRSAWMQQHWPHAGHKDKLARFASIPPHDPEIEAKFLPGSEPIGNSVTDLQRVPEVAVAMPNENSSKETKSESMKPEKSHDLPRLDVFNDLVKSMQEFFSQQSEQQSAAHELQLRSLREVLKQQSAILQQLPPLNGVSDSKVQAFSRPPQLQALPERSAASRYWCSDMKLSPDTGRIQPSNAAAGLV